MKKIIIILFLCLLATGMRAQEDKGAKMVPVSQAIQKNGFTLQVGLPYLGQNKNSSNRTTQLADVRFPWDVLYLYSTFTEESFEVSKGYFGDKVLISWDIRSNLELIKGIKIYKREYKNSYPSVDEYIFVGSVAASATQYEDKYAEGGVLYQYKVVAEGVSKIESLYSTYITGIGYRNPTAIVTGNISYKGGNPVKDVVVMANAAGTSFNQGSSLNIPAATSLNIENINTAITTAVTYQAWVKPTAAYTDDAGASIKLFKLSSVDSKTIEASVNLKASTKKLEVTIGGSTFTLGNYFPSGAVNARGDDVMVPVTIFNTSFVHFSVVMQDAVVPTLYINGREITTAYKELVNKVSGIKETDTLNPNYFAVTIPTDKTILKIGGADTQWTNIDAGGGKDSYVDEIRVWKAALLSPQIRTDYSRYISGNDSRLVAYLRANEKVGQFAYDLSRNGFNYNKNHGNLGKTTTAVSWATGSGNFPTASQLGVLGVTDVNGNYEITSIPYSGTGESFTITPLYGQHKFEPGQQLVFLGQGSEVVNKINFIDKSSFSFKGKVLFDTRGVFLSDDKVPGGATILDEGYNYYTKGSEKFSKGEYWMNNNKTPTVTSDDYLDKYASIKLQGANVFIDGNMVLDENNMPVVSNDEGYFDVSVPIGNHYITVKKDGHVFSYDGRFPAVIKNDKGETTSSPLKEFFEDSNEPVVFVDNTRVTVIGKVVGGAVEWAKPVGFGGNGLVTQSITDANGITKTIDVSASNNIGVAKFILGFDPPGEGKVTASTKYEFDTNSTSGEYRVTLMPLQYQLLSSDLTIPKNSDIKLIKAETTETLDFSNLVPLKTPVFKYKTLIGSVLTDKEKEGLPYHYEKSFSYRSDPDLTVVGQTSDATIKVNGVDRSTADFSTPIYTQFKEYEIVMNRFEKYVNKDVSTALVYTVVPVTDGALVVTNNLLLPNTEKTVEEGSKLTYTFQAGLPNVIYPFTKSITLGYRINDKIEEVKDYKKLGIILGGASDGSQTFTTQAPDIPAVILRDPPGSNSFATIEKGESISFSSEASFGHQEGATQEVTIGAGVSFQLQGGAIPTPKVEINTTNSGTIGVGVSNTSEDGKSVNTTYTFSESISTSDDKDYVGADGDLYIGNSKNIFYGAYDNVEVSGKLPQVYDDISKVYKDLVLDETCVNLGSQEKPIYLSKQKALSLIDKPTETFFVYSQKHILDVLIPEYRGFLTSLGNVPVPVGTTPQPDKDKYQKMLLYKEQIRLWKNVILKNEKSKYLAKNKRAKYKESLATIISNYKNNINAVYDGISDPVAKRKLTNQLNDSKDINNLLNSHFEKNVSFDAGVGEYSQSTETSVVEASSTSYNLVIDESIGLVLGFDINGVGIETATKGIFQQDINSSLSKEHSTTSNISYTLKDNDKANYLSVDVINTFDGNGPIFSTLGGRTSCPHEGSVTSKFYPETEFDKYFNSLFEFQSKLNAKNVDLNTNETEHSKLKSDLRSAEARNNQGEVNSINQKIGENRGARSVLIKDKETIEGSIKTLDTTFESNLDNFDTAVKAPLSTATQKVEVPILMVTNANMSNISEGRNAEFELILQNNSASGIDADYLLIVDNTTNPNNALINIEQSGTIVHVPYNKNVIYKMTLGKSISDVYVYDKIKVRLQSLCDGEDVSSSVLVSAHFTPSCSQVIVDTPSNNWVYNKEAAFDNNLTTKPLQIELNGFNTKFNSFKKIVLEYRLATSSNWTPLKTYYKTEELRREDYPNDVLTSMVIGSSEATLSYLFDIAALKLMDGKYEIRARSTCTNNTEFISDIITGRVDLNSPLRFGTPLPIDGILGAGEDLKVSFNEPIFYNSAVSTIEIKGQTNQLKIDHNVSLHFEGAKDEAVINNPRITTGDITFEFWMKNGTTASTATIISQKEGLNIKLESGKVYFNLGSLTANGLIETDNLFHHYTFTHKNSSGELHIYQDDKEIGTNTGITNVQFSNNNPLVVGGNSFSGNMHDLRLWNKTINVDEAYAKMYAKLIGNEANLIGYWPMDEGRGTLANDKARYKHAIVKEAWDIKPKGTSYEFANGQYLELDQVGGVQLTKEMDATVSFWMKTGVAEEATLFSNERGDTTDLLQSNAFRNKWAINMISGGKLTLESEGKSYVLASQNMADDTWHHVTLLFNRLGSLRTYVDAVPVSSNPMANIAGFSGNKIWLGARGSVDGKTVDRSFAGKLDEFQIWNTLRNVEQISRDRYNEVDPQSIGLLLYARMNQPDPVTTNGPRYYHYSNNKPGNPADAVSSKALSYSNDVPPIKPERALIKFQVNNVIKQDEMILTPVVTDWASLEGQIVDITVDKMFDDANNMQQSPITWTAYIKRNEVSWFAEGYNEIVDIVKKSAEDKSFEITLLNKGGKGQLFAIENLPKWLTLSKTSGTIAPDSKIIVTATIDKELTPGEYLENLYLKTDFGFDEKMQVKVRVLAEEPDWTVNPKDYTYSMNIVGRIKVDGKFSVDTYDKIAAFSNGKVRGSVKLVYNAAYQEYYAFLTVYSNVTIGETIDFKIWDASQGKIIIATMNTKSSIPFEENGVLGKLSLPVVFENSAVVEQKIGFNKGWTWVSLNVKDANFSDLNKLTENLNLETSDRMMISSPARLETYFKNIANPANSGWSGTISANGGLSDTKMIKVYMANEQSLVIKGIAVDVANWSFPIQPNWNWLPYALGGNQLTNEALAYFDATDGDVIKSQNLFAIYDTRVGWNGTLKYLESGTGYMIKSSKSQTFKYPSYLASTSKINAGKNSKTATVFNQETIRPEFKQYGDNMNAVVLLPKGYNELFVYDSKGVLKGAAVSQTVSGAELSFITVYGGTSEELVFYIGDGINKKKTAKSFNFKSNEVLGTLAKPVVLEDFSGNLSDEILVFPNPFETDLNITVNAVEKQEVTIRLYSLTSQLLFSTKLEVASGVNELKIEPQVAIGVYLLQIDVNGETKTIKVIKN
jgi:hypothetical protein